MCMVKCFSEATSSKLKAYYPAIKKIFAIPALFFLSDNAIDFLQAIKHERSGTLSIHWA